MTLICSEKFHMAMTFKDWIPDGDEVFVSIRKGPSDDMLERLYKAHIRESDQLNTVLASKEREIEQHESQPSHQKLKTMVKKCVDQKIRARNVEARNKRTENAINGKHEGSAQKETLGVSAMMRTNVENRRARPLLLPIRRRKAIGKIIRKKSLSEVRVRPGRNLEDRAMTTLAGYVRTIRVIIGIHPCVRITTQDRDADSVKSSLFSCTESLTVSVTKDRKRMVEKVLLPY